MEPGDNTVIEEKPDPAARAQIRRQLGVGDTQGLVVAGVDQNADAARRACGGRYHPVGRYRGDHAGTARPSSRRPKTKAATPCCCACGVRRAYVAVVALAQANDKTAGRSFRRRGRPSRLVRSAGSY